MDTRGGAALAPGYRVAGRAALEPRGATKSKSVDGRRLRFSLRTLFVVVTLGGIGAWACHSLRWVHDRQALIDGCAIVATGTTTALRILWLFGEPGRPRLEIAFPNNPEERELSSDQSQHLKRVRSLYPEASVVVLGRESFRTESPAGKSSSGQLTPQFSGDSRHRAR